MIFVDRSVVPILSPPGARTLSGKQERGDPYEPKCLRHLASHLRPCYKEGKGIEGMTRFELASLIVSWLTAVIALKQLRSGTLQLRRQNSFDHIRAIALALQEIRDCEFGKLRQGITDFYEHKTETLAPDASQYLQFLDALDLLGLAYKENVVDRPMVKQYFHPLLLNPNTFDRQILEEIRHRTGGLHDYEHLELMLRSFERHGVLSWFQQHIHSYINRTNSSRIEATRNLNPSAEASSPAASTQEQIARPEGEGSVTG